jgi:hypothetical protein
MSLFAKVTICFASLWFVTFVAFAARASGITQLLGMLVTPGFLIFCFISLVRLYTHQGREGWRVIIPFATCFLTVALALWIGPVIRPFMFQRALPYYESVISRMESGKIPVTPELRRVPQVEDGPAYAVLAQRTNGVLTVEFLTGGGFPVKHSGYLYCSSGSIEPDSVADRRWPKRRELKPLWFQISD